MHSRTHRERQGLAVPHFAGRTLTRPATPGIEAETGTGTRIIEPTTAARTILQTIRGTVPGVPGTIGIPGEMPVTAVGIRPGIGMANDINTDMSTTL